MRWPFWATEKKDDTSSSHSQFSTTSTTGSDAPRPPTTTRVSSWSSPNLPTDWRHYTSPDVLFPSVVIASSILIGRRLYRLYLRRFTGASHISPSFWRKRSLLGHVTSVGDGDGFRMFHTPGGRLAGWGWLPGRQIPSGKRLKDNTISVRLAGVDAPENAHFGHPAQPGGPEALAWLREYLTGRTVRAYIWRKDQYDRAVATVYVRRWGGLLRRDVGLLMLKRGLATVYEAKTGSEFGDLEEKYRRAEFWAKTLKRGIWRHKGESPREFKDRMKNEEPEKAGKNMQERTKSAPGKGAKASSVNGGDGAPVRKASKETKS